MSKLKAITTKEQLGEAARELLAEDSALRWRWKEPKRDHGADAILELALEGHCFAFDVEFKLAPTARDTDQLAERKGHRPWLLIAPYLSDILVAHCRERGLNCLDLNGRVWLRAEGLLVDRQASTETRVRAIPTQPDVFSPKSSRLLRALLNHPGQSWYQSKLVESTGLSPGLVSRLTRHLLSEGLLERDYGWVCVKRPDALLDAWASHDNWAKRTTIRQYSLLESDLNQVARKLQTIFPNGQKLIFTQWFAANLRRPYTTPPVVSAYVSAFDDKQVELGLGGRRVVDGGTLWLIEPEDEGVFLETQRAEEFTLVCDAQIYLDLLQVGLRGPDQAKALREWEEFGRKKA